MAMRTTVRAVRDRRRVENVPHERRALDRVVAESKNLLELVDDDEQGIVVAFGQRERRRHVQRALVRDEPVHRLLHA